MPAGMWPGEWMAAQTRMPRSTSQQFPMMNRIAIHERNTADELTSSSPKPMALPSVDAGGVGLECCRIY